MPLLVLQVLHDALVQDGDSRIRVFDGGRSTRLSSRREVEVHSCDAALRVLHCMGPLPGSHSFLTLLVSTKRKGGRVSKHLCACVCVRGAVCISTGKTRRLQELSVCAALLVN